MRGFGFLVVAAVIGLVGLAAAPVRAQTVYFVVGEWPG